MQFFVGLFAIIQFVLIVWAVVSLLNAQRRQAESLEKIAQLLERSQGNE
jgi:flagellar biogenesis protein FliO